MAIELEIAIAPWALPLEEPCRYKGAKGGRGGGKSHHFAEALIERHVCDRHLQSVCIREVQNTLDTSVKKLIEEKLIALGVRRLFDVQVNRILDTRGRGMIIFKGMQDYNAVNIKSLEGFDIAWVEEAQNLSQRSLQLLKPTIRKDGSEIWFTWNPENESDPVDRFFANNREDSVLVTCNLVDNPFAGDVLKAEMEADRKELDVSEFHHIWEGGYRILTKDQVMADRCRVASFVPGENWDGPYYGADWGFGIDPTVAVELWISDRTLYIHRESYHYQLELDAIPETWQAEMPGMESCVIRADSARPDTISYMQRHGYPLMVGAEKGKGSIEDGIQYLRSFDAIVIHPRCKDMQAEARDYRWKTNRAGDILAVPVDANNHGWDSCRYALEPLHKGYPDPQVIMGGFIENWG